LFPFWKEQFDTWTVRFGEGFVFSRYTLLWLMRQAFSTCPTDGNHLNTGEGLRVFGEACLIANDLAAFTTPKPLPTDLAVAANFIPQTEYFSQEDYDRDIARTLYLLTDLAPRSLGTVLPAFAERLQVLLGYDVTRYCDLAFASAMKPLAAQTEAVENYRVVTIAPADFTTTTIPVETAEQFLNSMAAGEQDFRDKIVDDQGYASDFTVFRERPFLRRGADLVPIDLGFVLDKAGRSLFWTALKNCPEGDRETLLRQWGHLFQSYVHAILSGVGTPGSTLFDGPIFSDDAEVSDSAVREGTTLILLECKASTIRSGIKYADDPAALERVLESRFVQGEGHGRKGLAQLSHAIKRFAEGNAIVDRLSGHQILPADIRKIIPVLIHLDNALRTPGIPHYMSTRFKSFGRAKRFTVTPLVLLPITELEELEGHLARTVLSEFLESFMSLLKADKTAVFLTRVLPILKGETRRRGATLTIFDRYMDGLVHRLFPDGEQETL
jgi:hypothetical protein